jgi:hypothetical protein
VRRKEYFLVNFKKFSFTFLKLEVTIQEKEVIIVIDPLEIDNYINTQLASRQPILFSRIEHNQKPRNLSEKFYGINNLQLMIIF